MAQRADTLIPYRPDISVRGEDGRLIAFVQVKNARVLSGAVALALYRDIIAESAASRAPYFLLLSQRLGFLWKQAGTAIEDGAPAAEFPMAGVVARYLPELAESEWLDGRALDFIMSLWLTDLAIGPQAPMEEPEKSLAASGFLAAIAGASVRIGATD